MTTSYARRSTTWYRNRPPCRLIHLMVLPPLGTDLRPTACEHELLPFGVPATRSRRLHAPP